MASGADRFFRWKGILVLISLQDFFHAAKNPLEAIPIKVCNTNRAQGFDASLPADIMKQCQFSKVFSLLVPVDHFGQLICCFCLLSHQLSLENDVKLVSLFALLDHVLACLVTFLFENVQELFFLNRVYRRKDLDPVDHAFVELPLFEGSLFNHLAECYSIQTVKFSWRFADDGRSPGSIVHEGKFSKCLSMAVSFKVLLLPIDYFRACIIATIHDKEVISTITFCDHALSFRIFLEVHSLDEGFFITGVDIVEEDGVSDEGLDEQGSLLVFGDFSQCNCFLLIEAPEDLLGYGHPAAGLSLRLLLDQLSLQLSHILFLLSLRIRLLLLAVFLRIILQPVDGKGHRVGRPFLDEGIDEWLHEYIDLLGDVFLDFSFLRFHLIIYRTNSHQYKDPQEFHTPPTNSQEISTQTAEATFLLKWILDVPLAHEGTLAHFATIRPRTILFGGLILDHFPIIYVDVLFGRLVDDYLRFFTLHFYLDRVDISRSFLSQLLLLLHLLSSPAEDDQKDHAQCQNQDDDHADYDIDPYGVSQGTLAKVCILEGVPLDEGQAPFLSQQLKLQRGGRQLGLLIKLLLDYFDKIQRFCAKNNRNSFAVLWNQRYAIWDSHQLLPQWQNSKNRQSKFYHFELNTRLEFKLGVIPLAQSLSLGEFLITKWIVVENNRSCSAFVLLHLGNHFCLLSPSETDGSIFNPIMMAIRQVSFYWQVALQRRQARSLPFSLYLSQGRTNDPQHYDLVQSSLVVHH